MRSLGVCVVLALGGCCLDVAGVADTNTGSAPTSGGTTGLAPSTTTAGTTTTGGTSTGGAVDAGPYVTTVAGNGKLVCAEGPGGSTGTGSIGAIFGITIDAAGNLYISDFVCDRIRKIDPSGDVSTVSGPGTVGWADGTQLSGVGPGATWQLPGALAVDPSGRLYVADNNRIRVIEPNGSGTTLAGNGAWGFMDGTGGPEGTAEFTEVVGVVLDASGNVYALDQSNQRIRKIDSNGNVTTFAGNGDAGYVDGPGATAEFNYPLGMAMDTAGNLYVLDSSYLIRKIDPSATVVTLTVTPSLSSLSGPNGEIVGISVDVHGNIYLAAPNVAQVLRVDTAGNLSVLAGNGIQGDVDGFVATAELTNPGPLAVDPSGNVYVGENGGPLREVHP